MAIIENRKTQDEVLREVREIKEQLGASHGFDVRRILDEARANQAKGGRAVIPSPAAKVHADSAPGSL